MKEYKAETVSLGFRNRAAKLETFLNSFAQQGWEVLQLSISEGGYFVIFERNKNR